MIKAFTILAVLFGIINYSYANQCGVNFRSGKRILGEAKAYQGAASALSFDSENALSVGNFERAKSLLGQAIENLNSAKDVLVTVQSKFEAALQSGCRQGQRNRINRRSNEVSNLMERINFKLRLKTLLFSKL